MVAPDGAALPTAPRLVASAADPAGAGAGVSVEAVLDDGSYVSVSDIARTCVWATKLTRGCPDISKEPMSCVGALPINL